MNISINEIVLVTENWKGTETNFLCTFQDYIREMVLPYEKEQLMIAFHVRDLEKTQRDDQMWTERYLAANKSISARFCVDIHQLRSFLHGALNSTDQYVRFDEIRCSNECLEKLKAVGLDVNGKRLPGYCEKYEELKSEFSQGDFLYNFNGSTYRVLEKLTDRNLLLMDVKTGNFVVALGTKLYARYPKKEGKESENCVVAIEWEHGVYLGGTPSYIDFQNLRDEYGMPNQVETLEGYRKSLESKFHFLQKISKSEELDSEVREAARNSLYSTFRTAKAQTFQEALESGDYDRGFQNIENPKEEKRWAR